MTIFHLLAASGGTPAPIVFVGSDKGSASGSANLTLDNPGVASGDTLVFLGGCANSGDWTLPSGFEAKHSFDSTSPRITLCAAKQAGGSEPSTYTFTAPGTDPSGILLVYRNAAFGWASDDIGAPAPGMRIPYTGGRAFAFFFSESASRTFTTPTGYTAVDSNTTNRSWAAFEKNIIGAQAAGNVSSTVSSGSAVGFQFFLYPSGFRIDEPEPVGQQTNTGTGGSLTINVPAEAAAGRLMVAVMSAGGTTGGWAAVSGWTEVLYQGSAAPSMRIAYRYASSEPASYTFTTTNSVNVTGGIFVFDSAAWDTVGSITVGSDTSGVDYHVTPASITPSDDWARLLKFTVINFDSRTFDERDAAYRTLATEGDATAPSWILTTKMHGAEAVTSQRITTNISAGAAQPTSVLISLVRA